MDNSGLKQILAIGGGVMKPYKGLMRKKALAAMAFLFLLLPIDAGAVVLSDYAASPPFLPGTTDPNILILLDQSINMVRPAYGICDEMLSDCKDNFFMRTDNYDSTTPYYGIFDNAYSDVEDDDVKKSRWPYSDSISPMYDCSEGNNATCEKADDGEWNGNWLNWLIMTQYDIMKKVFVGGNSTNASEQANLNTSSNIVTENASLPAGCNPSNTDCGRFYKLVSKDNASGRAGYSDFTTPQDVAYSWYSTPSSGVTTHASGDFDGTHYDATLPFDFEYYGTTFMNGSTIDIGIDGYVSLTNHAGFFNTNVALNSNADPKNLIAVYWDDQAGIDAAGSSIKSFTLGTTPNRIFVVTWENMINDADASDKKGPLTYQLLLTEGGQIITQYKTVTIGNGTATWDDGETATIGVKNVDGSKTKLYSYNTEKITDEKALFMTPEHMIWEIVPNSGSTDFFPSPPFDDDNEYIAEIDVVISNKSGSCDTGDAEWDFTVKNQDKCSDHELEGLMHELRGTALGGSLGFRLSIMMNGYDDSDGAEIGGNTGTTGLYFNETIGTSLVVALRHMTPFADAPIAEGLYEAMRYYQQAGAQWSGDFNNSPKACGSSSTDPFCYDNQSAYAECCKSFILLISSGNYSHDFGRNIYDDVVDSTDDSAPVAAAYKSTDGSGTEGARDNYGWADDVAYKLHMTDARTLTIDGESESTKQEVSVYVVNTYGEGVGDGTEVLKRTAKYGGFEDSTNEGTYDSAVRDCDDDGTKETGEDDKDCDGLPDTYFEPSKGSSLKDKIVEAVAAMLKTSASGTSVSVLSTAGGGQGAIYQAYFYPARVEGGNQDRAYTGYVRSFFIDRYQNIRDDASGTKYDANNLYPSTGQPDGKLILADVNSSDLGDYAAIMHEEDYELRVRLVEDPIGKAVDPDVTDADPLLNNVMSLFEAGEVLAKMDKSDRNIFAWVDDDLNGVVKSDGSEIWDFKYDTDGSKGMEWAKYLRAGDPDGAYQNISGVETGFRNTTTETEDIIDFVRGEFVTGYRNRCITIRGGEKESYDDVKEGSGRRSNCDKATGETDFGRVWALGDIINATPTLVSSPGEKYDEIYGDPGYRNFRVKHNDRRKVIYVGANDGMLHAFNAGFYEPTETKFCVGNDSINVDGYIDGIYTDASSECGKVLSSSQDWDLGEEMWAFIPHDNLPHLAWLACNGTSGDPSACGSAEYTHVYYVDKRPKVTDVRIFSNETGIDELHPGGWGTILIMGMRLGGGAMDVDIDGDGTATGDEPGEEFRSAYYMFDITDPEVRPPLLGRFSHADLGFTTSYPAIARIDDDPKDSEAEKWYAVFGSGPLNQIPALGDRDYAFNSTTQKGRIFISQITESGFGKTESGGTADLKVFITEDTDSIMADPSVIDVDLDFNSDVIYIGATIGVTGGKIYRITMSADDDPKTTPTTDMAVWERTTLYGDTAADKMGPYMVSPSASMDSKGIFWVYFGTGRLKNEADKSDIDQQRFYAIKDLCWKRANADNSDDECETSMGGNDFSYQENDLFPATDIIIYPENLGLADQVSDCGGTGSCKWGDLINAVRALDGWYTNLGWDGTNPSERALGRSVVLGGLLMFTTYTPDDSNVCSSGGSANFYALYFETGTAFNKRIFQPDDPNNPDPIEKKKKICDKCSPVEGPGIAGNTAFVQLGSGEIMRIETQKGLSIDSGVKGWIESVEGGGTIEIEQTYKHLVK